LLELNPQVDVFVIADPDRLRQVLVNLLSNAVKFTNSGEVLLSIGPAGGPVSGPVRIEFSVSDTGIGIAASQLAVIFDDFAQADRSTSRRYGGTGLGLGICRRIVAIMGGDIEVESVAGEGTTFSFSLPLPLAAAQAVGGGVVPILPQHGRGVVLLPDESAQVLNILIAEDNDKNQKLLKAYLGKTGHRLTLVEDGVGAVEKAEQEEFDLVLMDVRMPRMDGLTAARAIRERERLLGLDTLPILALTADAGADEAERSLAAGCNAHLTKPISKGTLLSAIKKYRRKGPAESSRYESEWRVEASRASNG
jgi:CheY-like chemotaxis protein